MLNKTVLYVIAAVLLIIASVVGLIMFRASRIKNYNALDTLSDKNETLYSVLVDDFYGKDHLYMEHAQRLVYLQHNAIPKTKQMRDIAQQLSELYLPTPQKRIADLKSKMIIQECNIYDMLYKEVAEQDTSKYRPAIFTATMNITRLGRQLAIAFHKQIDE